MNRYYKYLCLLLVPFFLYSCESNISPGLVTLQYGYGGGTVAGTIVNNSSKTISAIDVSVRFTGSGNRSLGSTTKTIEGTFYPRKREKFRLWVGGPPGARNAVLRVTSVRTDSFIAKVFGPIRSILDKIF